MPIFHRDVVQGTRQWLELRAGVPTASSFDAIVTPSGKPSKSSERYMYSLLAERLLGEPIVESVTFWMQRGSAMETDALNYYRFQKDCETEAVGFVTNDEATIGASPDQLVGDDGLLEIKCPSPWQHVGWLMQDGSPAAAYRVQCQGQLWVCERQWVDVLSYYPGLPEALVRVERDEKYIESLAAAVTAFSQQLESLYAQLCESGLVKAPKKYEPSLVDILKASMAEMNK